MFSQGVCYSIIAVTIATIIIIIIIIDIIIIITPSTNIIATTTIAIAQRWNDGPICVTSCHVAVFLAGCCA